MFERISRGWTLTKQSFRVLNADREILIFPILSMLLTLGIIALFLAVLVFGLFGLWATGNESFINAYFYLLAFIGLIFVYFISLYFKAAVITSATIRFSERNPTLGDGLSGPTKKFPKLFLWALINAVITTILNALNRAAQRRSRGIEIGTSIGTSLFSAAWSILTFFVVPIILFENESTLGSIKRSKDLFIKTWGETATGIVTTGGIFFLLGVLGFIPLLFAFLIGSITLIKLMLLLFFLWVGILIVMATSVNGILTAALYQYAITHRMPHIYDPETEHFLIARR